MRINVRIPSHYYKNGIINWSEPEVSHVKNQGCMIGGWHSVMACHVVRRAEIYPTVFWFIDSDIDVGHDEEPE